MKTSHFILPISFIALAACHIPSLSGINFSDCLHQCSVQSKEDCKYEQEDTGPNCMDQVENCFHTVTNCTDDCLHCEERGTCTNESECNNNCAHQTETCTDMIQPCIKSQEAEIQDGLADNCVAPLVDCVSDCAADVEDALRK